MLYPPLATPLLLADPRALGVASERLAALRYVPSLRQKHTRILQLATYGMSELNFMCIRGSVAPRGTKNFFLDYIKYAFFSLQWVQG